MDLITRQIDLMRLEKRISWEMYQRLLALRDALENAGDDAGEIDRLIDRYFAELEAWFMQQHEAVADDERDWLFWLLIGLGVAAQRLPQDALHDLVVGGAALSAWWSGLSAAQGKCCCPICCMTSRQTGSVFFRLHGCA